MPSPHLAMSAENQIRTLEAIDQIVEGARVNDILTGKLTEEPLTHDKHFAYGMITALLSELKSREATMELVDYEDQTLSYIAFIAVSCPPEVGAMRSPSPTY